MKENKIWGETALIWMGNNSEVHRIKVDAGGYCSKHYHKTKFNLFFVESGELVIDVWNDNGIVDKTVLKDGESTAVPPGVFHKFTATKDTQALEVYWVHLKTDDIVREDTGGKITARN
jgi:mannose-6-phosphate isomerase-like protein (cupin superfamily)